MNDTKGKVYFVGSGPGDPELVTVKALRIISEADVVVYADSLVPEEIAGFASPSAEVYGTKSMALPEIMEIMLTAVGQGKTVARVQSGDPSVYGPSWSRCASWNKRGWTTKSSPVSAPPSPPPRC